MSEIPMPGPLTSSLDKVTKRANSASMKKGSLMTCHTTRVATLFCLAKLRFLICSASFLCFFEVHAAWLCDTLPTISNTRTKNTTHETAFLIILQLAKVTCYR